MLINTKRFSYKVTEHGRKRHIVPLASGFFKALCMLVEPGFKRADMDTMPVCKICWKEYPKVSRSALFAIFVS